ncbi:unnamed protein product [Fraxinus pennsylvanica]|uniref:Cytochrome c oxidase subunit 2 n=2 Tax=Fraxinus TaxID=38871 RepID=A0AAD1ZUI4_9LAMI|nr:unnamed protein product [Fraxinus pennsylvanica]
MAENQTRIDPFSIFYVTQNERNRLPRNRKEGQVGLRTRWSKEREGPDSGTEPYDARVYTLELRERDPKQSSRSVEEWDRQQTLAIRWILEAAFKRRINYRISLEKCSFAEILDAYRKRGIARKKRENLHGLASTNRSFAHFRWCRAPNNAGADRDALSSEYRDTTSTTEPWQLGSQDAATPMMQGIIDLHHDIFFFLILIFVFVSWILVRALWHFHYKKNPIPQRIVHGTTIEILWTIFPSIILMFIAIPSFALLYSMDEVVVDPAITIKAIGHQWYWTYEYSDYNSSDEESLTFDSYTIPEDDPELGQSRLLEVDNRVVVPEKTHLRIIVTPADVPHSWAVPSLGVKCDAVPGRLNQTSISVQREGVYYGQCSEICGTNHAFTRAPGNIGRLLSPLWLSRTTQGASHPISKLLQRAAGAVWSRGARQ